MTMGSCNHPRGQMHSNGGQDFCGACGDIWVGEVHDFVMPDEKGSAPDPIALKWARKGERRAQEIRARHSGIVGSCGTCRNHGTCDLCGHRPWQDGHPVYDPATEDEPTRPETRMNIPSAETIKTLEVALRDVPSTLISMGARGYLDWPRIRKAMEEIMDLLPENR